MIHPPQEKQRVAEQKIKHLGFTRYNSNNLDTVNRRLAPQVSLHRRELESKSKSLSRVDKIPGLPSRNSLFLPIDWAWQPGIQGQR
jgi:hypothetical protein